MKNSFKIISAILVILLIISGAFSYKNYTDYKKEITEKEQSLTEIKNDLDTMKKELESIKEQRDEAQEYLESVKEENESLKNQLKESEDKLKETQDALEEANKALKLKAEQQETGKIAYLTFDDGVSANTPELLEVLDKYGVKATFFPNWKPSYKDYYNLILEKGHSLGNHTATHEWSTVYSSLESFKNEVNTLSDRIYEQTGFRPTLFRFPGGTSNTVNFSYNGRNKNMVPSAVEWITSQGYAYFDWNVDSGDADGKKYTPDEIAQHVLSQSKGKEVVIVLMHDAVSKHTTIEALPKIIEGLKEQGFEFRALTNNSKQIHFNPAK